MTPKVHTDVISIEKGILCSILVDKTALTRLPEGFSHETFFDLRHKILFREIQNMIDLGLISWNGKSESIDVQALGVHLKEEGLLEQAGGEAYLADLVQTATTSGAIEYYAKRLLTLRQKERLEKAWDKPDQDFRQVLFEIANEAEKTATILPPLQPADTKISQFIQEEPSETEFIFKGLLPRGVIGGLVSQGGTGKSIFLKTLGLGIASGQKVLGCFDPSRPMRVLALFAEDPEEIIHQRLYNIAHTAFPNMSKEVREAIEENFYIKSLMGAAKPLMELRDGNPVTTSFYRFLRKTIEAHKNLDLLILDPKSRFYGLEENSNEHNATWVAILETLAKDYGLTVLFSHHVSKALHGTLTQGAARGGSALVDACRWVANLRPMDEVTAKKFELENPKAFIEFDVTKNNYAPHLPTTFYFKRGENGVLQPVNLEFTRIKDKANLLYSLLQEEHDQGNTFTRQELLYRPAGKEIRKQMECKRKDLSLALDFALKEGTMRMASLVKTGGRPKWVIIPERKTDV